MYDKSLARAILEKLDELFPDHPHLYQLQAAIPEFKSAPPQAWYGAVEALRRTRQIDGNFLTLSDGAVADLTITDAGRRALRESAASVSIKPDGEKSTNLTPSQENLLLAIVDAHTRGQGSRFTFTHSHSGSALHYQGHGSIRVEADENDLALLGRRRLVMILSKGSGPLIAITSQLTQFGIEMATTMRDRALASEEPPLSATSTTGSSETPVSQPPSWQSLQSEFLQYAAEHAELAAVWRWVYPEGAIIKAVAIASSRGRDADPNEVLRQLYRDPDGSARPPAPRGLWALERGSPLSQDLFRVIAGRGASRLPNLSEVEPWRLWLDGMRAEGYAPEMPARSKSGQILGPYPQGFEDRHIEHVFKASADFCYVRSLAETALLPVTLETPDPGYPVRLAANLFQESAADAAADPPRLSPDTPVGRPKLPTEALQNITDAEKAARGDVEKSLAFHSPSNPNFVYHPVEINAGCWKVIEHLTAFAEAIFNAQAREYVKHYPALVLSSDLLMAQVGSEVVRRTKLHWTRWETEIDLALRARWLPEYYRAYVEDANKPGSEDLRLVEHFLRRLDDTVADRSKSWRAQASAGGQESPPKPEHAAQTTFGDPKHDEVVSERAARRRAVVNPILEKKRWKAGRLVTESAVGKATVYGYLDGTRGWIDEDNRKAIAECLDLKSEELPD